MFPFQNCNFTFTKSDPFLENPPKRGTSNFSVSPVLVIQVDFLSNKKMMMKMNK